MGIFFSLSDFEKKYILTGVTQPQQNTCTKNKKNTNAQNQYFCIFIRHIGADANFPVNQCGDNSDEGAPRFLFFVVLLA